VTCHCSLASLLRGGTGSVAARAVTGCATDSPSDSGRPGLFGLAAARAPGRTRRGHRVWNAHDESSRTVDQLDLPSALWAFRPSLEVPESGRQGNHDRPRRRLGRWESNPARAGARPESR
jgi:hypothetical protein